MRKLLVRFFAVMGALLLLCGAVDLLWTGALAHDFEQRIEELRAAGEPVDFESLAGPPVPDDQNAAIALLQAGEWYENKERSWADEAADEWGDERSLFEPRVLWRDIPMDDWSADDWKALRAYVADCKPFFELVEQAVVRPYCRFDPATWADELPELSVAMTTNTAFRARALVEGQQPGGSSKVARTAKALMSMRKLHRPRSVLAYLVGLAPEREAIRLVREATAHAAFDARAARAILDERLRAVAPRSEITHALRGERAWVLGNLGRWFDGAHPWVNVEWPTRRHTYKDVLKYMDIIDEAIRARPTDDPAALDRKLEEARFDAERYPFSSSGPALVARLRLERVRHQTAMNLARVALAVLEEKQERGVWPPTLDEIRARFDDGLPLDPFTNAPFAYERTETGVRLAVNSAVVEKRYSNPADMEEDNLVWNLRDG